ncbi:MAG: DUF2220 family protein [Gammaproteobacteria bacterium]|nr:DUF2220 family protein [Gammaproteobacteria bacterium]
MRSPTDLAEKLARQWQQAALRERRLLDGEGWPLELAIGKPTGRQMAESISEVRRHVARWREVTVGEVVWEAIRFRAAAEAVELPVAWRLRSPSEWIAATGDAAIKQEYRRLERLVVGSDERFHRLLVVRRHLHAGKPEAEVSQATQLAGQLTPGCAAGAPLRALALAGIDSKFFERHRRLVTALLDVRFDGAASELGLEGFLGALDERDHWLLLADLDGGLLPFRQLRVRDKELAETPLPAANILVVENEQSLHQLPQTPQTIAILGAGLNLAWLAAPWLAERRLAYWGDIDSWGLTMLARARRHQGAITPLLMGEDLFECYKQSAVTEPHPADATPPQELDDDERVLYRRLLAEERGRLEQEFIPTGRVDEAVTAWACNTAAGAGRAL